MESIVQNPTEIISPEQKDVSPDFITYPEFERIFALAKTTNKKTGETHDPATYTQDDLQLVNRFISHERAFLNKTIALFDAAHESLPIAENKSTSHNNLIRPLAIARFKLENVEEALKSTAPDLSNTDILATTLGSSFEFFSTCMSDALDSVSEANKNDIIAHVVTACGLDMNQLSKKWALVQSGEEDFITQQLMNIIDLEMQEPGICKMLFDDNISIFGRYSTDMLLTIYRQRNDTKRLDSDPTLPEVPYNIMAVAIKDENGGMSNITFCTEYMESLQKYGYRVRLVEWEDELDLAKKVYALRRKFGKCSDGVIWGHGNKDFIAGSWYYGLTHSTMISRHAKKLLASSFINHPTILFNSCSTGLRDGIAQTLSTLHVRTIAPDAPCHIESITITQDDKGRLLYNPVFEDDNEEEVEIEGEKVTKRGTISIPKKEYVNGEEVIAEGIE